MRLTHRGCNVERNNSAPVTALDEARKRADLLRGIFPHFPEDHFDPQQILDYDQRHHAPRPSAPP
ncbi:hypothetical protein [Streptomonospora salina]|uniref:Uncharacterized protein n=1 Tax=Streptomonospora salina TaxID=104205 RepID=A0A841EFN9_9ACTN|nr:hypothetical protein [Streptomonospora salina]MBB6000149.1 hypothetical protein [Streptomonospora salina]